MSELTALFAVLGGLAFVLVNIAIWSPRNLRVKMGALATAAVFLPAAYMSLSEMLSRPKPVSNEWARRELAEATVIGSQMVEGQAIYVWLGIEGVEAQPLRAVERQARANFLRGPATAAAGEAAAGREPARAPALPGKPGRLDQLDGGGNRGLSVDREIGGVILPYTPKV